MRLIYIWHLVLLYAQLNVALYLERGRVSTKEPQGDHHYWVMHVRTYVYRSPSYLQDYYFTKWQLGIRAFCISFFFSFFLQMAPAAPSVHQTLHISISFVNAILFVKFTKIMSREWRAHTIAAVALHPVPKGAVYHGLGVARHAPVTLAVGWYIDGKNYISMCGYSLVHWPWQYQTGHKL